MEERDVVEPGPELQQRAPLFFHRPVAFGTVVVLFGRHHHVRKLHAAVAVEAGAAGAYEDALGYVVAVVVVPLGAVAVARGHEHCRSGHEHQRRYRHLVVADEVGQEFVVDARGVVQRAELERVPVTVPLVVQGQRQRVRQEELVVGFAEHHGPFGEQPHHELFRRRTRGREDLPLDLTRCCFPASHQSQLHVRFHEFRHTGMYHGSSRFCESGEFDPTDVVLLRFRQHLGDAVVCVHFGCGCGCCCWGAGGSMGCWSGGGGIGWCVLFPDREPAVELGAPFHQRVDEHIGGIVGFKIRVYWVGSGGGGGCVSRWYQIGENRTNNAVGFSHNRNGRLLLLRLFADGLKPVEKFRGRVRRLLFRRRCHRCCCRIIVVIIIIIG